MQCEKYTQETNQSAAPLRGDYRKLDQPKDTAATLVSNVHLFVHFVHDVAFLKKTKKQRKCLCR